MEFIFKFYSQKFFATTCTRSATRRAPEPQSSPPPCPDPCITSNSSRALAASSLGHWSGPEPVGLLQLPGTVVHVLSRPLRLLISLRLISISIPVPGPYPFCRVALRKLIARGSIAVVIPRNNRWKVQSFESLGLTSC